MLSYIHIHIQNGFRKTQTKRYPSGVGYGYSQGDKKKKPVSLGLVRFLCKFWIWLGFCHSYRGVINATNYQIKVQRY